MENSELPKRYNDYPELVDWYYEKYNSHPVAIKISGFNVEMFDAIKFVAKHSDSKGKDLRDEAGELARDITTAVNSFNKLKSDKQKLVNMVEELRLACKGIKLKRKATQLLEEVNNE